MKNTVLRRILCLVLVALFAAVLLAPQGVALATTDYYAGITATSGQQLLGQLHDLITSTHTHYTSYNDCKNPSIIVKTDAGSNGNVMEFYSQADISSEWGKGSKGTWNREHVWCQSLSNGMWGESGGGSDLHHIRPSESSLNSTRGNDVYGEVANGQAKYYKDTSGNNVAIGGYQAGGVFEPLDQVKGDVARIVMYVYTHYNTYSNVGGTTNGSGSATFGTLHFSNIIDGTEEEAIQLLLEWNKNDPVDDIERNRNEAVYKIQGNRNPFVDNENFADAIWGGGSLSQTPPTSLAISNSQLALLSGETATLSVTPSPATASTNVTWSSSNNSVATVSAYGVVTAVSQGTATITATSTEDASVKATATVKVRQIESLQISGTPQKTVYTEGQQFDATGLTVTAVLNDGTKQNLELSQCQWLDGATGQPTLSAGTTQVVCKVGSVQQTVDGISVLQDASVPHAVDMTALQEGVAYKLVQQQGNNDKTLYIVNEVYNSYYMAFTEDASEGGDVYVQLQGDGFYLYFEENGVKNYLNAEVSGTHVNLVSRTTASTVWQYDQANKCIVATVTVSGSQTTVFVGTYNFYNSFSVSNISNISTSFPAYLAAYAQQESVSLDKSTATVKVGDSLQLQAQATGQVSWTSSNEQVAMVDQNGLVTAIAGGTTTVTAICGNAFAQCVVTVSQDDSVTLQPTASVDKGSTLQLQAQATGQVSWTSSNEQVATVDQNGVVTALAEGTTTITATCGNASAQCVVTVTDNGGVLAFEAAVREIDNDGTLAARFEAINKANQLLAQLSQEERQQAEQALQLLQQAVDAYNNDRLHANAQHTLTVQGMFATAAVSLAALALLFKAKLW